MTTVHNNNLLRSLPQVDQVLKGLAAHPQAAPLSHEVLVACARKAIDDTRQAIQQGQLTQVDTGQVISRALHQIEDLLAPSLTRVINATGVILHTNLGRSPLAPQAIDAVTQAAQGYSTLEYNTQTRNRGSRSDHYEQLLCMLTGAQAALAVNNNAAAVLLVLKVFASGRQAVVSRGELVEIGGSFRIPDIMAVSGAHMVEVGTTNKTHLADYSAALQKDTALLLKVHPSNYQLVGFTQNVGVADLRTLADQELARRQQDELAAEPMAAEPREPGHLRAEEAAPVSLEQNVAAPREPGHLRAEGAAPVSSMPSAASPLLVYEDQGSGALIDLGFLDGSHEPSVRQSLAAGADVVSFSGDKLLGGPQAGIIVGKAWCIERLRRSPLARCLRLDKLSLAALEATLRLYLAGDPAEAAGATAGAAGAEGVAGSAPGVAGSAGSAPGIPTLEMLTMPLEAVRARAANLLALLEASIPTSSAGFSLVETASQAGGGSLPLCEIPSVAVQVTFVRGSAQSCERFLATGGPVPIICRTKHSTLLLDARTLIAPTEPTEITNTLSAYFAQLA